jgi:AmmeMemoRadiSam system protein B
MLPHAGHIFCGTIIATTLSGMTLPRRLIILAPSHTGAGHPLGYWEEGAWETPLGDVPVDAGLGRELSALDGGFAPDEKPHLREHDIEVLLPFLQTVRPDLSILPIVVGRPCSLPEAGRALAWLIRAHAGEGEDGAALILSSDMNHYADEQETRRKDQLALKAFLSLDPAALADVVGSRRISMCGVLPALAALTAARELGAGRARLMAYGTSSEASGDASRVVGYAGVRVW